MKKVKLLIPRESLQFFKFPDGNSVGFVNNRGKKIEVEIRVMCPKNIHKQKYREVY